ncbi:MAG: hypothetical protein IT373_01690 [Polyangiaceae bacterium]|nr:hypothetical protein [Polyangiaceae bacterium]
MGRARSGGARSRRLSGRAPARRRTAVSAGVPVPALSASLAWFDTIRLGRGSAALIQAQRDLFGATPTAASRPPTRRCTPTGTASTSSDPAHPPRSVPRRREDPKSGNVTSCHAPATYKIAGQVASEPDDRPKAEFRLQIGKDADTKGIQMPGRDRGTDPSAVMAARSRGARRARRARRAGETARPRRGR